MRKVKKTKPKTKYTPTELKALFLLVSGAVEAYVLTPNLCLEEKLVRSTLELLKIRLIKTLATPATTYRFTFKYNEKAAFCIASMNGFITTRDVWTSNFLRLTFNPLHQSL